MIKKALTGCVTGMWVLAISGCGGGGSGGSTPVGFTGVNEAAMVTADNEAQIADAAVAGARQTVLTGGIESVPIGQDLPAADARTVTPADSMHRAARARETVACTSGGTLTVDIPGVSANATTVPQTGVATFSANQCAEDGGLFSGQMSMRWNGYSEFQGFLDFTVDFDLTVTFNGITERVRGKLTCANVDVDCLFDQYFEHNNQVYQLSNVSAEGDALSGLDFSARVYDPSLGYVDVSGTGLTLCSGETLGSGSLSVNDASGNRVMDIEITSCSEFVVTRNGVSTTYQQV
jgi:hypothetical protein